MAGGVFVGKSIKEIPGSTRLVSLYTPWAHQGEFLLPIWGEFEDLFTPLLANHSAAKVPS